MVAGSENSLHSHIYENEVDGSHISIIENCDSFTVNGNCMNKGNIEESLKNSYTQNSCHKNQESHEEIKNKNLHYYNEIVNEECPMFIAFLTCLSFGVILIVGYVKEFFFPPSSKEKRREDYVPLYFGFENFYVRNVFRRIQHCWATPICSVPGSEIEILGRSSPDYGWTLELTGEKKKCINVGSYNYLGFAQNNGPCHDEAETTTKALGITTSSPRNELGTMQIHVELESLMAEFLKVEDVLSCGMGFATNVLNIPSLLDSNCLVLSDEFNHASIILGIKVSGATVKVFRHNDMKDLESKLRHYIIYGHPRTHRPWKKIFIFVEGIYSMEGTICNLPELISLKKKYKAYLYVDEAHSIGALGPNGGGVVDYFGMDSNDVDILMGTFTKSFGAAGGYIAGSKELISFLRSTSDAQSYAASMTPPVAQQILSSLKIIMGRDGTNEGRRRIMQLSKNVRYFRKRLRDLGFILYGHDDSPVVPLLVYLTTKLTVFVDEFKKRGVASVGVGFPATKLNGARMRFCLSASHTKEHLDHILQAVDEIGDLLACKHSTLQSKSVTSS